MLPEKGFLRYSSLNGDQAGIAIDFSFQKENASIKDSEEVMNDEHGSNENNFLSKQPYTDSKAIDFAIFPQRPKKAVNHTRTKTGKTTAEANISTSFTAITCMTQ